MNRAFSLVELSIVLVILGLLVGGVLSGQSLIRAAELRAVSAEYSRYVTATQSFKDKYFAIPGDMNNATRFWGRLNNNADCVTNSSAAIDTARGVCDGNGDGLLNIASPPNNPGLADESFQFWRQLGLAGLIEAVPAGITYTPGSGGTGRVADRYYDQNSPKSKYQGSFWAASGDFSAYAGAGDFWSGVKLGNSMWLITWLTSEELWNIDTKLDDGKPGSGKLISGPMSWVGGGWGGYNSCSVSGPAPTAAYNVYLLSNTYKTCQPFFVDQF